MKTVIKIWALAILMGILTFLFVDWSIASATGDKYDGDCPTPPAYATTGRCADKCPNPTDNLVGYDKETGAAICNAAPTGCPYGDAVPLGPECDKLAPQQPAPTVVDTNSQQVTAAPTTNGCFGGK